MLTPRRSTHIPPQPSHLLITDYSNTLVSQPPYNNINNISNNSNSNTTAPISNTFTFGADQSLFDFHSQTFDPSPASSLMQPDQTNNSWFSNGQLTPTSTTRSRHHRESSLSSLGSAGPASPYTANTSNPQVAGENYHDFNDFPSTSSKPLTPVHTPSQEHFLAPHYSNIYTASNLGYTMANDGMQKQVGDAQLMPSPAFNNQSGRPQVPIVASNDSSSTPLSYEDERQKNGFRSSVPKLNRTMTDVFADELYGANFVVTSAAPTQPAVVTTPAPPRDDVFSKRLQAANSSHLNASNSQLPLTIPARDRSPFRQGSPLAPSMNAFAPQNSRLGTASHMREQQKAENDAQALQRQFQRTSPQTSTPNTISPKDVDLVYHESEEDSKRPLFPPQQQQQHHSPIYRQPAFKQEASELDDTTSQQSYGSMATSRRESTSNYSTTSQAQVGFNFTPPSVPGSVRQIPQQYPFVPQTHREPSGLSEGFSAILTSMDSSSSEYAPDSSSEVKRPASTTADTGTYTCTYHGCTLRFDTPAKLQRHKREGHRNSASVTASGVDDGGMTSAAQRNSQAGPHKCERINPSTGKPCNTIFSRPYDLTRHEDTIHNARKQKVHCPLCTEEKTFSRNDALTRHLRVVHPEHVEMNKSRRRGG